MIVFTLINEVTEDVWVGTTREDVSPEDRFKQIQDAQALGIDHPFYKDLKAFGPEAFSVNLFAVAEERSELQELLDEALESYNAKSLVGIKTVRPGTTKAALAPKAKPRTTTAKTTSAGGARRSAPRVTKEKLSSGRTGSAAREKAIKEGIEAEKAAIAAAKAKRVMDEAAEMKAIMASLDARGSTLSKR